MDAYGPCIHLLFKIQDRSLLLFWLLFGALGWPTHTSEEKDGNLEYKKTGDTQRWHLIMDNQLGISSHFLLLESHNIQCLLGFLFLYILYVLDQLLIKSGLTLTQSLSYFVWRVFSLLLFQIINLELTFKKIKKEKYKTSL